MIPYVRMDEVMEREGNRIGYTLLDERHGCVNGCRLGISVYIYDEYGRASAHEDQEGFFVLEGRGMALIDGEELALEPGMAFMIPAGTPHAMKKDKDCGFCKVLWFHGAV
ncbi:MAG: cupin domain-containing protein [Muribaculum sp.]|nr:cupin domain-containing protein [Muribaculum sp.]